jgi:putative spermidine/putrescine transport system substrate-binding protein/spermidine/putrescine transport system substrate-binding protein
MPRGFHRDPARSPARLQGPASPARGSPRDPELAHAWVNFFLDKSVGERVSAKYGYGNTTSESEGLDYADKLTWLRPAEDFAKRTEIWNEVKATPVQ